MDFTPMMEACFEGIICGLCGCEIGENEEYVWNDEREDYICLNCHEEKENEKENEKEDELDGEEDRCDRCGMPTPCKQAWGENLCPACYEEGADGFL